MAFWKFFFKHSSIIDRRKDVKTLNLTEKVLLVKFYENKGYADDIYLTLDSNIDLYDLENLCDSVGWVPRPLKKVQSAIENSFLTVSLFHEYNSARRLIGFARATSDTVFNATIWDVVVHPEFQGQGLGRVLISQLIKQLRYFDISTITLFADPQVISFYNHLGFVVDPDGVKGMFWYPL